MRRGPFVRLPARQRPATSLAGARVGRQGAGMTSVKKPAARQSRQDGGGRRRRARCGPPSLNPRHASARPSAASPRRRTVGPGPWSAVCTPVPSHPPGLALARPYGDGVARPDQTWSAPRAVRRPPAPGALAPARSWPAATCGSSHCSGRSATSREKSRPLRSAAGTVPVGDSPAAASLRHRRAGGPETVVQYPARMAWIQHGHGRRTPSLNGSP